MPALIKISYSSVNADGAQADADKVRTAVGRLNTDLRGMGSAGESSERGLTTVRRGLSALAFEAAGVPGPIGRISEGLLQLGGGHMLVLGAVAGLATVVLSMKAISEPTTAATKSLVDFTKSLKDARDPGERLRDLLLGLAKAQEQTRDRALEMASAAPGIFGFGAAIAERTGLFSGFGISAGNAQAQAARDALTASRHDAAVKAITDLELQTAAIGENAEAIARVRAAQEHWNATDTEAFALSARKHEAALQAQKDLEAQLELMQFGITMQAQINNLLAVGIPDIGKQPLLTKDTTPIAAIGKTIALTKDFGDGFKKMEQAIGDLANAAHKGADSIKQAAASIISAAAGLIAGLISGGSFGGFLAGAGGLIGLIPGGQIAGAIVGGLGTILLANESNEQQRHNELLKALEPVGEVLFLVAQANTDPDSLDSLVRRMEQATGRRITVRPGGR